MHEPIRKIITNELDIKLVQFTQEELYSVLKRIKNRKAAGLDKVPPEVQMATEFDDILLRHRHAVNSQNTIDRWTKRYILPFPMKGDLGIAKNYRGLYIHSGQDLQCSTTQPHITRNGEDTLEEPKWLSEKSIHDIKDFVYMSNSKRCTAKNLEATILFTDFSKALTLYTEGRWSKYYSPSACPKKPSPSK